MDHKLRILHLEDLPTDAELVERVLRKSGLAFEKLVVDNRDAYVNALHAFNPDIVLSDHSLPSYNSREALTYLKTSGVHLPFILITSTISEEFAVEIIKLGAADYVLKDRLQRLPSAVNNALELHRLEKEKQQFIAELIGSEKLMNEAEEMAHFGSLSINLQSGTVKLSSEARRIFGFGPAGREISFGQFFNVIHPDDALRVKTKLFDALKTEGSNLEKCGYRIIDETGGVRYIYSECRLEAGTGHAPAAIKGFIHDITEMKVAENLLRKSEANLQTVFNNTDTGYVLFAPDQKVISFNNQADVFATGLFGRKIKEGAYAADYFAEKRMPFINEMFGKAIRGEDCAYETSQYNADGLAKWYYTRWLGIADNENQNLGVIMAISDITERKNAELEKEKISADLIQRNNALEQFAFIVSHNLRAPVANIIGLSTLLTSVNGNVVEKESYLDGLARSAVKLDEVVHDLNHILRISRRVNEQKEVVYFQQLVEEITLALGERAIREQVIIKTDFLHVPNTCTLKSYLYNIFYNLIINSINYRHPMRPPVIEIKSQPGDTHVKLSFKDNGRGIDLAKHGRQIFGLYQRFDMSVEGRGMGLCMVKTQVQTLGGSITVESELNRGTVFTVELPV